MYQDTNKDGMYYEKYNEKYLIKGKTYNYKEEIKKRKFTWEKQIKAWLSPEHFTENDVKNLVEELNAEEDKKKKESRLRSTEKRNETLKRKKEIADRLVKNKDLYSYRLQRFLDIHKQRDCPPFFPSSGVCFSCGIDIFNYLDPDIPNVDLILGCPRCYRSYCD